MLRASGMFTMFLEFFDLQPCGSFFFLAFTCAVLFEGLGSFLRGLRAVVGLRSVTFATRR